MANTNDFEKRAEAHEAQAKMERDAAAAAKHAEDAKKEAERSADRAHRS